MSKKRSGLEEEALLRLRGDKLRADLERTLHVEDVRETPKPATEAVKLDATRGMQMLRDFVRKNRWRLHDLFSRSGLTDDYRMTSKQICTLLEPVSGLSPFSNALKHKIEYAEAAKSEGTLLPMSPSMLKQLVDSIKADRYGLIDYRELLDDYTGKHEMEQRQRLDRVRRQRMEGAGRKKIPPVHTEIAQSLSQTQDPYSWLENLEVEEQKREVQLEKMRVRSRLNRSLREVDTRSKQAAEVQLRGGRPPWGYGAQNEIAKRWQKKTRNTEPESGHSAVETNDPQEKKKLGIENTWSAPQPGMTATTTMDLRHVGFSKADFHDLRSQQFNTFKAAKMKLANSGFRFPESKLLNALISPCECGIRRKGWQCSDGLKKKEVSISPFHMELSEEVCPRCRRCPRD